MIIGLIIEKKLQPDQEKAGEALKRARHELNSLHNNPLYCNSMGNLPFLFKKWFSTHKQFLVFQSKALSSPIPWDERQHGCNDGPRVNASRSWYIFDANWNDGRKDGRELDNCKIYRCTGNKTYHHDSNGMESGH